MGPFQTIAKTEAGTGKSSGSIALLEMPKGRASGSRRGSSNGSNFLNGITDGAVEPACLEVLGSLNRSKSLSPQLHHFGNGRYGISPSLFRATRTRLSRTLDRLPTPKEMAYVLSGFLDKSITPKRVRAIAERMNEGKSRKRQRVDLNRERNSGIHDDEIIRAYEKFLKRECERPTGPELLKEIEGICPGRTMVLARLYERVRDLKKTHKDLHLSGETKVTKAQLADALSTLKKRLEGKPNSHEIREYLEAKYEGLKIQEESIRVRLIRIRRTLSRAARRNWELPGTVHLIPEDRFEVAYGAELKRRKGRFPESAPLRKKLKCSNAPLHRLKKTVNKKRAQKREFPMLMAEDRSARTLILVEALGDTVKHGPRARGIYTAVANLLDRRLSEVKRSFVALSRWGQKAGLPELAMPKGRQPVRNISPTDLEPSLNLYALWAIAGAALPNSTMSKPSRAGKEWEVKLRKKFADLGQIKRKQGPNPFRGYGTVLDLAEQAGVEKEVFSKTFQHIKEHAKDLEQALRILQGQVKRLVEDFLAPNFEPRPKYWEAGGFVLGVQEKRVRAVYRDMMKGKGTLLPASHLTAKLDCSLLPLRDAQSRLNQDLIFHGKAPILFKGDLAARRLGSLSALGVAVEKKRSERTIAQVMGSVSRQDYEEVYSDLATTVKRGEKCGLPPFPLPDPDEEPKKIQSDQLKRLIPVYQLWALGELALDFDERHAAYWGASNLEELEVDKFKGLEVSIPDTHPFEGTLLALSLAANVHGGSDSIIGFLGRVSEHVIVYSEELNFLHRKVQALAKPGDIFRR